MTRVTQQNENSSEIVKAREEYFQICFKYLFQQRQVRGVDSRYTDLINQCHDIYGHMNERYTPEYGRAKEMVRELMEGSLGNLLE